MRCTEFYPVIPALNLCGILILFANIVVNGDAGQVIQLEATADRGNIANAGVFAGEAAYAVGYQVERGFGTFDIGVTSSGGEIGAGVGVGLKIWH